MSAVALLAPHVEGTDNEICVLSNIQELPDDVLSYIRKRVPTFFPTTEDEAKNLFITEIPLSNDIKVSASCGMGVGDLILSHARKIP